MRTETAWLCLPRQQLQDQRSREMCVIPPLQPTNPPSALDKWGKKEDVETEVRKEELFLAYPEKSPSRLRPLDHRSGETQGWYRKALNLVASFADGARGSADARAEVLVQHFAPQRAVESTGRGTASSTLGHAILRACPYPSYGPYVQQSHLPVGPKPFQKTFVRLKAFEDRGAAIFNTKCHAQWWKEFRGKFIHS